MEILACIALSLLIQLVQCNSMGLISFLSFQCKTAFNVNTCHVISNMTNILQLLPLFDVDHLEIANCSDLTIVFYPLGNRGQALCIRSCYEDLNLTRNSNNCIGIAFIQETLQVAQR